MANNKDKIRNELSNNLCMVLRQEVPNMNEPLFLGERSS